MPHRKEHRAGRKHKHTHAAEQEAKDVRLEDRESDSEREGTAQGQVDRKDTPATYTAMTVDRKEVENAPPAGEAVVSAGYDQQDGITKAKGIKLPVDALPDQVPGVPNVPVAAMVVGAAPAGVPGENAPLPDQIPGVPNVPAVVVTDGAVSTEQNATATSVNPDAVQLTQLPR